MTLASMVLFIAACFAAPGESRFDFDDAVTRPAYLLVLGYLMAYWGEHELALRRRLQLLKDIARPANARLGIDHAVAQSLRRVDCICLPIRRAR